MLFVYTNNLLGGQSQLKHPSAKWEREASELLSDNLVSPDVAWGES